MLKKILFKILRYSGLPFLLRELVQRNRVTVLMYHDPDIQSASEQFRYLKRNYHIIHLNDFIRSMSSGEKLPSKSIVVTFDDGHVRNYKLLPILTELEIPVTIFICSGIINTNRHYWFLNSTYFKNKGLLKSLSNKDRLEKLANAGFHQDREYENRQSLNATEIEEMRSWVNFQSHTVYHPCLDRCTQTESSYEITQSKLDLEEKYNLHINAIAFPNGDYSHREIAITKEAGYQCALTVAPGYNTLRSDPFTLKRLSTNDTTSMDEFIVRVSGLWGLVKSLRSSKPKTEEKKHEHQDNIRAAAATG